MISLLSKFGLIACLSVSFSAQSAVHNLQNKQDKGSDKNLTSNLDTNTKENSQSSIQNNSTQPELFSQEQDDYAHDWDVSGYIKTFASLPTDNRHSKLELDDLSIYVSGNINRWLNPFVEAEYFGARLLSSQKGKNFKNGKFIFERLYNDFKINNEDRIRLGKFLAPVGYWNLIHAAPLVWTVNRPLTSTYSYSNYITGLEYGHTLNSMSGSRIDFYAQFGNEYNPKPLSEHPRRYKNIAGASWTIIDDLDSRSSIDVQYAKVKTSQNKRLTFSFQKIWYLQTWDIDTQIIYTKITNTSDDYNTENVVNSINKISQISNKSEFSNLININSNEEIQHENGWDGGGYLQARYRYSSKWNFYGRGEYFHLAIEGKSGQNFVIGTRYHLGKWGNINVEFKSGSGAQKIAADGFSISYNAMFR